MSFKQGLAATALLALIASSAPRAAVAAPAGTAAERAADHDFDWEIGTWTTKVRVRRNPLSGEAPKWADYSGTSVVRSLLGGRSNFVELSVDGPAGKIEGGSLRLYSPQSRQWSLNYTSLHDGRLTAPVYGAFDADGRGLFYGQDSLDGRVILVRFVITRISKSEAHFEQAYSADGGVSWEDNWIAVDTLK
jgi:hypothetical protein